jgi:energy-coupling factor transport system ATP-binding protein
VRASQQQIRIASYLAIGFVAARLAYAFVFSGLDQGPTVLISPPEIRLPGIFAHIQLLGEVTLEGILANALMALPFSIAILSFGILASFLSPQKLFDWAGRFKPFGPLLTVLAISWAQLPALAESVMRINRAIALRRERRTRMLIPVLETAVERALSSAIRVQLESRKAHSTEQTSLVFESLKLTVKSGEAVVISGPTSSGKSSLLLSIGALAGELGVPASADYNFSGSVGYLPQQPRGSMWGPRVRDEIQAPTIFDLVEKLDLATTTLSEGEAVQTVIERELAKAPDLLLLDEPLPSLDQTSKKQLISALRRYLDSGGILVVVEHQPMELDSLSPKYLQLSEGQLIHGVYRPNKPKLEFLPAIVGSDLVAKVEFEQVAFDKKLLLDPGELSIHQSQAIAISGANGIGKSTLLNQIAKKLDKSAALVPERFEDFFVTLSLEEELSRADKIAKARPGLTKETFQSIVGDASFAWNTHPRDLSQGTKLALAISMQLSHKPRIIIIDEPVKGFDPVLRELVANTLKCVRETGTAIIFATHDLDFAQAVADTLLKIENRRLLPMSEVLHGA